MRDNQKQQVQAATDIVQLIGEQLALKSKGREFVGLCPFHDDTKPSMTVVPAKQIFHCFACGTGGDVFGWMMKYHKMTFPEALRFLADRAGIKITTYRSAEKQEGPSQRQLILDANAKAQQFFSDLLNDARQGQIARQHLEQRGVSLETVQAFGLGYAPDSWDALTLAVQQKQWNRQAFEAAGLIAQRNSGSGHYDRMRHRLIFPIFDAIGQPIAFGGRVLPDTTRDDRSDAKYLNSPESILFNKSATLYGLNLAMKSIIASKSVVVVEGYTDVIACHQVGVTNVVATLGTAFTTQHIGQLRNRAEKVVLVFDADEAGQKAADRAVEIFLTQAIDVHVATLPNGLDPADLLAKQDGQQTWAQTIEQARDALTYQYDRLSQQWESQDTITGKQNVTEQYLQKLASVGLHRVGAIRRAMLLQRLSKLLGLPERQITGIVERMGRRNRPATRSAPQVAAQPATDGSADDSLATEAYEAEQTQGVGVSDLVPAHQRHKIRAARIAERQLLGCLIQDQQLMNQSTSSGQVLAQIDPGTFLSDMARTLFGRMVNRMSQQELISLQVLLSDVAEQPDYEQLADLATQVDREVEHQIEGDSQRRGQLASEAAEALIRFRRECEFQQTNQSMVDTGISDDDALRRFVEHRRNNPSPARIARLKR